MLKREVECPGVARPELYERQAQFSRDAFEHSDHAIASRGGNDGAMEREIRLDNFGPRRAARLEFLHSSQALLRLVQRKTHFCKPFETRYFKAGAKPKKILDVLLAELWDEHSSIELSNEQSCIGKENAG